MHVLLHANAQQKEWPFCILQILCQSMTVHRVSYANPTYSFLSTVAPKNVKMWCFLLHRKWTCVFNVCFNHICHDDNQVTFFPLKRWESKHPRGCQSSRSLRFSHRVYFVSHPNITKNGRFTIILKLGMMFEKPSKWTFLANLVSGVLYKTS